MIILIAGASHTGKTLFAQKLLEKYKYPYLSIDHLKMGLIRSGQTNLIVEDDEQLTKYLWSIVVEMIKTAIENKQNFDELKDLKFLFSPKITEDEDDRVYFVAISRAKENLFINIPSLSEDNKNKLDELNLFHFEYL